MTPSRNRGDTSSGAGWCTDVAAVLADVSARAGRLASVIADDWRDEHGREWAERTTLLHRELGRVAAEAAELGAALDPGTADRDPPTLLGAAVSGAAVFGAAGRGRGPRLGGMSGERADTDLGMRIAELPPP